MARCAEWMASLVLVLATSALAQPAPDAEALAGRANAAYQAGNHLEAVELYREAYGISRATAILYNIALIYDRKLDDEELAMQFYRQYLAAPDADPKAASRATARLQELKVEQQKAEASAQEAEQRRRKQEEQRQAEEERRKAEAQGGGGVAGRVTPSDGGGSGMRVGGWVAAGVGVAAIGTGVYFGIAAQGSADDFANSTGLADKKSLRSDGEREALMADVLYGVGGVAVITGVVLLLMAPDDTAPSVSFYSPDGTGAGLVIGGRL